MKYTWIASYPKSGNTWTRLIIASFQDNKQGSILSRIRDVGGSCNSAALFSEYLPANVTDVEYFKHRGEAFSQYANDVRRKKFSRVILKTHSAISEANGGLQIPLIETERGILVVRNPFDTMCSVMNHFGFDEEQAFTFMKNPKAILNRFDDNQGKLKYPVVCSSWSNFQTSWISGARERFPLLVVRYEDLLVYPITSVARISQFLGTQLSESDLARIVEDTKFSRLKNDEKKNGFLEASVHSSAFFNRGSMGYYTEVLSKAMIVKIYHEFSSMMEKLGYVFDEEAMSLTLKKINPIIGPR